MGVVPMEARYSVITEKNPREIVLLRGTGCGWKKCRFCDYHMDFCADPKENFALNRQVLAQVTGRYGKLEVINSGSFSELDRDSFLEIRKICREKSVDTLYFESHWMYRQHIFPLRQWLGEQGIQCKFKIGVETFDIPYREQVLRKGMGPCSPEEIARYFQQVCLLQGLSGQTARSMKQDIQTGLDYFERVCVNLMNPNTTLIQPDPQTVEIFLKEIVPAYQDDPRVDILIQNTDFGVGA